MNDLGTLVLIGIIVVAVFLLMKRFMGQQPNYSQQGNEVPHTDNPNISSHGGFGGQSQRPPQQTLPQRPQQGSQRPQNDNPNISSQGGFGGGSTSSMSQGRDKVVNIQRSEGKVTEKRAENGRDNDDPNVNSRGGFGKP